MTTGESFKAQLRRLGPGEQRAVRWMLDVLYLEVANSIAEPDVRWACNLLLQSPAVPLWVRPLIERALAESRYQMFRDAVYAGLLDGRIRGQIRRRYQEKPWAKLGLFPGEYAMGIEPGTGNPAWPLQDEGLGRSGGAT